MDISRAANESDVEVYGTQGKKNSLFVAIGFIL